MKKTAAKGHVKKHSKAATHKHHAVKAKHHPTAHQLHVAHMQHLGLVHAKAKHPAHAKAKALSLDGVACCTSEALASSLRCQGLPVSAGDVLALHRLAGADDDTGLPIPALLEAAAVYGLAGIRPARFRLVGLDDDPWQLIDDGTVRSLILGVDLPGPHAICDDGRSWWSWGKPYSVADFPGAVIEEAWAVTWA